jgi:hypothetical protein
MQKVFLSCGGEHEIGLRKRPDDRVSGAQSLTQFIHTLKAMEPRHIQEAIYHNHCESYPEVNNLPRESKQQNSNPALATKSQDRFDQSQVDEWVCPFGTSRTFSATPCGGRNVQ